MTDNGGKTMGQTNMITKFARPAMAVLIAAVAGCQTVLPPKVEPVALMEDQQPLVIDEATQLRDYEKSTLYYPSSATEAGSTRAPFASRDNAGKVERAFVEPALFLVNVASIPVDVFIKPPFSPYDWHGAVTDATYTAQPAYPVDEQAQDTTGTPGAPADEAGPVPAADSLAPSPSEPVRDPSGQPSNLPTANQGPNEMPAMPADNAPSPTPSPSDGAQ